MKSQPKYLLFVVVVALLIAIAYLLIQANQLPLVLAVFGIGGVGFVLVKNWKDLRNPQRLILIIGMSGGVIGLLQMLAWR